MHILIYFVTILLPEINLSFLFFLAKETEATEEERSFQVPWSR